MFIESPWPKTSLNIGSVILTLPLSTSFEIVNSSDHSTVKITSLSSIPSILNLTLLESIPGANQLNDFLSYGLTIHFQSPSVQPLFKSPIKSSPSQSSLG